MNANQNTTEAPAAPPPPPFDTEEVALQEFEQVATKHGVSDGFEEFWKDIRDMSEGAEYKAEHPVGAALPEHLFRQAVRAHAYAFVGYQLRKATRKTQETAKVLRSALWLEVERELGLASTEKQSLHLDLDGAFVRTCACQEGENGLPAELAKVLAGFL